MVEADFNWGSGCYPDSTFIVRVEQQRFTVRMQQQILTLEVFCDLQQVLLLLRVGLVGFRAADGQQGATLTHLIKRFQFLTEEGTMQRF